MVAGVVGHYRFVEFWSQKAWVFSQNAWVFSPEPLSFFQSTGILKIWSQIFGKMAVFCRKFAQKVPNIAFFRRASRKCARFWLIYSKNAENGMSFEIHLATIITGSLSFGLKNPWVFWSVEFFRAWVFFENVKKKPGISSIFIKSLHPNHPFSCVYHWLAFYIAGSRNQQNEHDLMSKQLTFGYMQYFS